MNQKHISFECKCKFYGRKCNWNQHWNNGRSWCECKGPKTHHVCKKGYVWNPSTCTCENGTYAGRIIENSVILCYCVILIASLLITIALFKAVIFLLLLDKISSKQKNLLPHHDTSSQLKEININENI